MYTMEKIEDMLKRYDGNHSLLAYELGDRLDEYVRKTSLPEGFEGMLSEFLCFESDYLTIKKDMILAKITDAIVDIGAQLGFQSELFLDTGYVGVECHPERTMFNEEKEKVTYINAFFPSPEVNISDKIVVSNMAISYFPNFIDKNREKVDEVNEMHMKELAKAKVLYFKGTPKCTKSLMEKFASSECLVKEDARLSVSMGLWKFQN